MAGRHSAKPNVADLTSRADRERATHEAAMHVWAEKLRGELVYSILDPLMRGYPARVAISNALDAREIFEEAGGVGQYPTIAEHLRQTARAKHRRKPEWEIYHALQSCIDDLLPGNTAEEKRQAARTVFIPDDAITLNKIDQRVDEPRRLGRDWSAPGHMDGLRKRFPRDFQARHPSLLAVLIARLDDSRRVYRKGETYLQPMPRDATPKVLQPPQTPRLLELVGDSEGMVLRPYAKLKLSRAPDPVSGEDVDNTAELDQALRAGKAIMRVQRRESKLAKAQQLVEAKAGEPKSRWLLLRMGLAGLAGFAAGAYFAVQSVVQKELMLLTGTVGAVGTAAALLLREERKYAALIHARRVVEQGTRPLERGERKVMNEVNKLYGVRPPPPRPGYGR